MEYVKALQLSTAHEYLKLHLFLKLLWESSENHVKAQPLRAATYLCNQLHSTSLQLLLLKRNQKCHLF